MKTSSWIKQIVFWGLLVMTIVTYWAWFTGLSAQTAAPAWPKRIVPGADTIEANPCCAKLDSIVVHLDYLTAWIRKTKMAPEEKERRILGELFYIQLSIEGQDILETPGEKVFIIDSLCNEFFINRWWK